MKLTTKSRWTYSTKPSLNHIRDVLSRDEWVHVASRHLPDIELDYIELGCAPGFFTAALVQYKPWTITGIDYSDDADLFTATLSLIGKNATLYKQDLFDCDLRRTFDVVASFGLVEHFRGITFHKIMHLHDSYTRPNGYIVIAVPNFTGIPYLYHYLFDRPDLDNHNIDVMQPETISAFLLDMGYTIIFDDYVGVMRLWGNSGFMYSKVLSKLVAACSVGLSLCARLLNILGIRLSGRTWSPYLLVIAQKTV